VDDLHTTAETDPELDPSAPRPEDDAEIIESQEHLGKAIDKARAGDDRAMAVAVREDGEMLVRVLYGLLRMIRLHDLDNEAFARPIDEFSGVVNKMIDFLGAVNIVSVQEQVYINDIRIRFDERAESGRMLGQELLRHRIGGVTIHQPLSSDDVKTMVHIFAKDPDSTAPRTAVSQALEKRGVSQIELFGVFRFRVTGEEAVDHTSEDYESVQEDVAQVVDRGADLVDDTLSNVGADRMPNPLPLRRVVTEIIEGGDGAEGLWDEAGHSSQFGSHVVRVSRVSLMIGRGLGLNNEALQDLGVAALFHDLGYAAREGAQPAKGDQPAVEGYAPPFERHAGAGARMLMRQRGFHQAKILRILATLEHHDDYSHPRGIPSLFARIIRIAEDFDNMIRGKGGGFSSVEAIQRMAVYSGDRYDPDIFQVFVNMMGKYPPGTMVLMDDGRIGVSVSVVRSEETFDKPLVRIVRDASGEMLDGLETLDMAEGGQIRLVLNSRPESIKRHTEVHPDEYELEDDEALDVGEAEDADVGEDEEEDGADSEQTVDGEPESDEDEDVDEESALEDNDDEGDPEV